MFWPNVFVTLEYRNAGRSPSTAHAVLQLLGMLETWGAARNIDVSQTLSGGPFLSGIQAEDLALFLRLPRAEQEDQAVATATAARRRLTKLEAVRPAGRSQDRIATNPATAATRIRWAIRYLEFHLGRRSGGGKRRTDAQRELEQAGKHAIARLEALIPRAGSAILDESLCGLDAEAINAVDAALDPANQSHHNPFRSEFVRDRNYLIWRFLVDTGMRRGELVWTRVDYVDYATRRVRIWKSKTFPRTVPISERASAAFHEFVMRHWSKIPEKRRAHGFLFVGKDGKPLTTDAINHMFNVIRKRVPGAPQALTPHALRRTWNDRFSAKVDAAPDGDRPTPEQEKQIRNRLMGWVQGSEMGARYARRYIREQADRIGDELANELINRKEVSDE